MKDLLKDVTLPLALIALLLGLGLLFVARRQFLNAGDLTRDGVRSVATVTEKTTHTTSGLYDSGFEERGTTDHIIRYEFEDPETGRVWEGRADVAPEIWEGMEKGGHYEVIFSKSDPSLSSLFGGEEFQAGWKLADLLGQGLAVLGVCGLILDRWLRRRSEAAL